MKIVLFSGGVSGGGAERVVCSLASYLEGKGHVVTLLTMSDDAPDYVINKNVKRFELLKKSERKGVFVNSIKRWCRLKKFVRNEKSDIFVVLLPLTTILLLSVSYLNKAKFVASERNDPRKYNIIIRCLLRFLAKRADGWVFQTEENRTWYIPLLDIKKTKLIPNAINPDFIKPAYTGRRKDVIVTAGRLTEQKNHGLLLRAFSKIHSKYKDFKLVIYGEGSKKEQLLSLANDLKIESVVVFPGYTTNIGDAIKDASLFVLSSDFEGMPNSLMEAMALGVPCISTDCDGGGARFLIENHKNGLLVPKGDVDAMATAMDRMLSDREFAEDCGKEAHTVCERLAPEKIYSEWESFLMKIVND